MKITVTGGRGFIGSNLMKELKRLGHDVVCFTREKTYDKDGIKYVKVNYHDLNDIKSKLNSEILIHLAATLFARSKKEFLKENVTSTINLVNASLENGVKKIIYISSLAAAGPSPNPLKPRNEKDKETPVSFYGLSKLLGEKEIMKFTRWTILRPPIVYGPKDDGFSTIAQWVKKGIMISPQNENSRFSFIFVNDLVRCIIKAIDPILDGKIFYVCEKNTYSWKEFIEKMAESMKVKKPKIIKMPELLLKITALSYEIFSYISSSKAVLNRDKVREALASHWIADPTQWEETTKMKDWTDLTTGLYKTFSNINSS